MRRRFPEPQPGRLYLSEGGQETEIMYKFGFDLPHFAMFTLLDDPHALEATRGMYRRYLEAAARHGCIALMGGLDYRASPDWAALLGYDAGQLADVQLRCIDFLREVAEPYRADLPDVLIVGIIGPRGDAYQRNETITADAAEEYHAVQLATLAQAEVDLAHAMTFNNVPEALGVSRAAATTGLPLCVSFTLDESARLISGPSLREAIEAVDAEAGESRPDFYGLNCSHPLEFEPALVESGSWRHRIRSMRPNAVSMEKTGLCRLGHLESGDPDDLGRRMGDLAALNPHVDVWGGCCGTWETHLDRIAGAVRAARA
jgi:homocysteine S-methyltransferase